MNSSSAVCGAPCSWVRGRLLRCAAWCYSAVATVEVVPDSRALRVRVALILRSFKNCGNLQAAKTKLWSRDQSSWTPDLRAIRDHVEPLERRISQSHSQQLKAVRAWVYIFTTRSSGSGPDTKGKILRQDATFFSTPNSFLTMFERTSEVICFEALVELYTRK